MKKYLVLKSNGMFEVVNGEDYESTYQMLKAQVGGLIECVSWIPQFNNKGIDLWINEEGKLLNLEPSAVIRNEGKFIELLCGDVVFARTDEMGETLPLNDEDIQFIKEELQKEMANICFNNPYTGHRIYNIVTVIDL